MPGEQSCPICQLCREATVDIRQQYDNINVCAAHEPILSWIVQSYNEYVDHSNRMGLPRYQSEEPHSFNYFRQPGSHPRIEYSDCLDGPTYSRELLISFPDKGMDTGKVKHNLNPKWVDLEKAKRWTDYCIQNHGSKCSNTFNAPLCSPAYLIDTKNDCILQPSNEGLDYVALSYRWGAREGLKTDKASVDNMAKKGSLRTANGIPATIHHAMHIVRSIGERYLWVDSICLISDDEEHMVEQLQLMGSIYARAKLTIVATDGDAWEGLLGVRDAPGAPAKSRDLPNIFWSPDGVQITIKDRAPLSQSHGSASEYFKRGWTFQEYHLSQRRLVFGKRQMQWSCSCATWHEDDPEPREASEEYYYEQFPDSYFQIPDILSGRPNLEELARLATEYQSRDFTHPEDALPGFAGLLALLTRTFEGGFLCGHPETWFDASLMWSCENIHGDATIERRMTSGQPSTLPGAVLPSWSWIGWKSAHLNFVDDEEDFELPRGLFRFSSSRMEKPHCITTPVTKWYSHETPTSTKRRIQSYPRVSTKDGSLGDSYQGWLVETYDPCKHPLVEDDESRFIGKSVYHHPAIPRKYFWAPFPKSSVAQGTSTFALKQHQYISCHTKRGWFGLTSSNYLWELKFFTPLSWNDRNAALTDDQGRVCGWLEYFPIDEIFSMPNYAQIFCYPPRRSETDETVTNSTLQPKIELVAVCRRRESCPCWPWTDGGCNCVDDFYGVLWVKWVDGVACRRGCGYVKKDLWESHKLEDVDLILG